VQLAARDATDAAIAKLGTPVVRVNELDKRFAGLAGSDTPLREAGYFGLPATAKDHCPLRDPATKASIGPPRSKRRVATMLCPPANFAIAVCVRGEFSYIS
jgi:hypothetical protein